MIDWCSTTKGWEGYDQPMTDHILQSKLENLIIITIIQTKRSTHYFNEYSPVNNVEEQIWMWVVDPVRTKQYMYFASVGVY